MSRQRDCPSCGRTHYGKGECWRCVQRQRYEAIMALTKEQAEARLAELLHQTRVPGDAWAEATSLVALHSLDTRAFADASNPDGWPCFFAKDASPETRDRLLVELVGEPGKAAGGALHALAHVGDDTVAARFRAWEQDPPSWREQLYVGPEIYALQADWEPTAEGARRDLTFPAAVAFQQGTAPRQGSIVGGSAQDRCVRCGETLVNAVRIDGRNPRFQAFGLAGLVSIPVCPWCATFADTAGSGVEDWVRYGFDGTSRIELSGGPGADRDGYEVSLPVTWIPATEYASGALPGSVEPIATGLWRTHADYHEVPVVGGHPMWLQDAEYARCPDCGERMRHLAWIPVSCLSEDGEEGIWYVQICTNDRVATTLYQQT